MTSLNAERQTPAPNPHQPRILHVAIDVGTHFQNRKGAGNTSSPILRGRCHPDAD